MRYRVLFWLSRLCLPATVGSAVFVLNVVNPMALGRLPAAKPEVRAVLGRPDRGWLLWAVILNGPAAPAGIVYARAKLRAT